MRSSRMAILTSSKVAIYKRLLHQWWLSTKDNFISFHQWLVSTEDDFINGCFLQKVTSSINGGYLQKMTSSIVAIYTDDFIDGSYLRKMTQQL